jgi:hypothetical protein
MTLLGRRDGSLPVAHAVQRTMPTTPLPLKRIRISTKAKFFRCRYHMID